MFNAQEIMRLLPHRYPFLLLDRIVEWEPGRRIVGIKNVTINEPFFTGHFPGYPIMPGVLIIEALAQVGGFLALKAMEDEKKIAYFGGIDNCKFRRPVLPGDQLRLECTIIAHKGPVWKMHGQATVDGVLAAKADLTASLVDQPAEKDNEGATR
ncbi:MAG: 3-hydroxyacyl-ACP dehydratase FabZ [Deltaproteobacteria bacterium]|nr:3-hydroxyacyl-ACP dehydratase FabZ [Deltaproteobacteria bacterium]